MMIESVKRRKLWKTKEKEISGLCTTGAETIGGYNLNGVYYSRDGQRLDDQPKKSWSQREYERAEREKYTAGRNGSREKVRLMRRKSGQGQFGSQKAIAIVVIVLGVVAIFGIVGIYLKSDNRTVGLIREAIQTIRDDDSSHTSENSHKDAEADSKSKTPDGKFKNLNGENVSYVHGFHTFALSETSFRFRVNFRSLKKPDLPSVTMKRKRLSRENPMVMHTMRRMELTAGRFLFLIHRIRILCRKRESLEDLH